LAQLDLKDKHVIDAGTGTGILAIMAIKRGAASVFAYDIDEWSVENTKDNLLLNHVPTMGQGARSKGQENRNQSRDGSRDSSLLPLAPCSLPPSPRVEVAIGDSSVLEGQAKANLLIANINRNILLQDLPRFAKAVKEKGRMILSGFYLSDVPVLAEAAVQQGFSLLKTESEGEWAMLLFEADALGGRDV
jgi:ribosomal protein L11 methyltransferase